MSEPGNDLPSRIHTLIGKTDDAHSHHNRGKYRARWEPRRGSQSILGEQKGYSGLVAVAEGLKE